ncbi:MAG TPA: hypothetical protein VKD22_15055, partial [Ramlibacter sp.]|nr:hypothetical protein [Ramlibacter sp.]
MRVLVILLAALAAVAAATDCGDVEADCAGVCAGPHVLDDNGACCLPADKGCSGLCFVQDTVDACGLCNGNNSHLDSKGGCCEPRDMDCHRVCNGPDRVDDCGVCGGLNMDMDMNGVCCPGRVGCTGYCDGPKDDACGVCGGDGTTCCGPGGDCGMHGMCSSKWAECVCSQGWTGHFCQISTGACNAADCGPNAVCDEDSGQCVCSLGYSGEDCEHKMCGVYGVYDPNAAACKCYVPFTGSDCEACNATGPSSEFVRICFPFGTDGMYFPREALKAGIELKYGSLRTLWDATGHTFFPANTTVDGVAYDSCCRALDADDNSTALRYTLPASEVALNAFLTEQVDYTTTTDQELLDLVATALNEEKRRMGTIYTVASAVVVIVAMSVGLAMFLVVCGYVLLTNMKPKLLYFRRMRGRAEIPLQRAHVRELLQSVRRRFSFLTDLALAHEIVQPGAVRLLGRAGGHHEQRAVGRP